MDILHVHVHDHHKPRHAAPDDEHHEPDQQWQVDLFDALSQQIHDMERRIMAAAADYQDTINALVATLNAASARIEAKLAAQDSTLDLSAVQSAVAAVDAIVPAPVDTTTETPTA